MFMMQFIYSLVDRHLCYIQFETYTNKAAMCVFIRLCVYTCMHFCGWNAMLGCRVSLCFALVDITKKFSKVVMLIFTPQAYVCVQYTTASSILAVNFFLKF